MNLSQKIWLLMTIPFVIAIMAYLAATRPFRRELLLAEATRDARDDVVVLQGALQRGLIDESEHAADLNALVESIAHAERVIGVAVYTSRGELLAVTGRIVNDPRPLLLAQRALTQHQEVRELRDANGSTYLEHAFILDKNAGRASDGVAVVVRDISYIDEMVRSWTMKLLMVGALFTFLMLIASRPVVKRVIEGPLNAVLAGVEKVSTGQLDVRVPDERRDELGTLARAFNGMTVSLRHARTVLDEEHAARAALEARLRHLQTLAAAGEVAASLAHEIGSPLNVILGRTRMMAARADTSDNTRRDLEIVAAQTERITRVVQKLLNISRPNTARVEEVELRAVVDETLQFLAPECKKRNVHTEMSVAADAPTHVRADRDHLVQILFNLCHNALQAQPKGGKIEVRIVRGKGEIAGAPVLEVDVIDAGPGVSPELRGRIFDPFVTTKAGDGGTGLGLAIVEGMVRELGGRVEVDDAPGGGACFRVQLPGLVRSGRTLVANVPPRANATKDESEAT